MSYFWKFLQKDRLNYNIIFFVTVWLSIKKNFSHEKNFLNDTVLENHSWHINMCQSVRKGTLDWQKSIFELIIYRERETQKLSIGTQICKSFFVNQGSLSSWIVADVKRPLDETHHNFFDCSRIFTTRRMFFLYPAHSNDTIKVDADARVADWWRSSRDTSTSGWRVSFCRQTWMKRRIR